MFSRNPLFSMAKSVKSDIGVCFQLAYLDLKVISALAFLFEKLD
jgi:hypothetical protein